ncbi:MAG: sulfatase [Phycisphaerales bacterium]|nr:sulfatase [Phycisphaerales bacterium]
MAASKPNILMVMLDSARPEFLSCYTHGAGTSPNIDRVAERGLVFQTAMGPSAWTFPVMASVFTGMLPTKHGGHDEHQLLDSGYPTLAEVMARNGYQTAGFADVPYVGPSTRLNRGFNVLSNMRVPEVSGMSKALKAMGRVHRKLSGGYNKTCETRVLMGEVLRWYESTRDPQKPFFLYVHTDETHAPFLPPPAYRRRFTKLSRSQMYAINQDKQLFVSGQRRMSDGDFANLRDLARAEVAYFDAWLGKLLDRLDRDGLLEDMVVVIAADHGDNFGEHGLLRHGLCLYDTLVHVPLIVKTPGSTVGGRVQPVVQLIDVFPTLLAAAGIEEPETFAEFQGRDLVQQARTGRHAEYVVSELYRPGQGLWQKKAPGFMPEFLDRYDRRLRAVRTNTHKFIWSSNGRHELFDIVSDPGETRNLVDLDAKRAGEMERMLESWLASFDRREPEAAYAVEDTADDRVFERLRELGYVE